MAGNGDRLSLDGFVKALQDVKIGCTDEEATEIFRAFDADGKGYIDMKEFLFELRLLSLVNIKLKQKRRNYFIISFVILGERRNDWQMFQKVGKGQ